MISGEWDSLTYEQKNQALFERQKHTLEEFLEHGAISKQQYEKSLHDLTEKMGTKEYLDIVDESGHPTGETISRDAAHTDGILHRTAHVWVVRKTDRGYDILLQKRSAEKDSFPGLYDTSSAGHIPAGDEPLESALRFCIHRIRMQIRYQEISSNDITRRQHPASVISTRCTSGRL